MRPGDLFFLAAFCAIAILGACSRPINHDSQPSPSPTPAPSPKAITWAGQKPLDPSMHIVELGFREDGIVVWRREPSPTPTATATVR